MTSLRLLADDLTGALDTAAAFVALSGEVACVWYGNHRADLPANASIDAASRELAEAEAVARHQALAPLLADADIAFKKLDSLLRGHVVAEVAALFACGAWAHVVLAPAFPFQGRITRGGRQYRRGDDGAWQPVGPDLVAAMQALGIPARLGTTLGQGVTVFDAQSDADLAEVVRLGRHAEGRVLWCGTAGLAQALVGGAPPAAAPPRVPVLGLFGSDQDVTAQQIENCGALALRLSPAANRNDADMISRTLHQHGAAMVGFNLPANTPRHLAASHIEAHLAAILPQLEKPGTLIVAGGETLRAICDILGATSLRITGTVMPGVPRSTMQGGAWDGVAVISKSGAFGAPNLLRNLLRSADIAFERTAP